MTRLQLMSAPARIGTGYDGPRESESGFPIHNAANITKCKRLV